MTSTTATESANSQQQQPKSPTSESGDQQTTTQPSGDEQANANATETSSPKKEVAPKPTVHKVDYEKDVVYLYQFSRCPTLPSASPFCLKVETFLRMADIKYENIDHRMKFKSKKGQLPFVELNGQEIADSEIIVRELSQIFEKDLDAGLTTDQRNVSHAFESMLNNHTSWVVRWWRYNNPGDFIKSAQLDIKRTLNSRLPNALLNFFFKIGFKSNVKQAVGHGLGRHTTEEIYDFGKGDLKALSELLANKQYFFGNEPHLLDAVAFAHLCQFIYVPFGGMKEWMETETANLVALVDRIKEKHWPDWDDACKTLELNTHLPKKETVPDKDEEAKKEEAKKKEEEEKLKKEQKQKEKEEKKKEKEEKKKKEKEERERKKKEEAEKKQAEKEKKEQEKKEREEKEKAEREEKEKKEKEEKEKKEAEEKAKAEAETKEGNAKEETPATGDAAEKKE